MSRLRMSRRTYIRHKIKTKTNHRKSKSVCRKTRKRVGGTKNSIIVHEYQSMPYLGPPTENKNASTRKLRYRRTTYDESETQKMRPVTPTFSGILESVDESLYNLKHTYDSSKDIAPHTETISIFNESQIAKPSETQVKNTELKLKKNNKIKENLEAKLLKLQTRLGEITEQIQNLKSTINLPVSPPM